MTDQEYSEILFTHGRRVANRAVLLATDLNARQLDDHHDCYGPEDQLPAHERCITGLIATFDPAGLNVHYPACESQLQEWPAPGCEGAGAADSARQ